MENALGVIGAVGYACAAAVVLLVVVSATRLRRLPLQKPARWGVAREAIPAEELALLDAERPRLERLGFAYRYSMATRRIPALEGKDVGHGDIYEHPDGTHAWVERADVPDYGEPVTVSFMTAFRDGTHALTVNRYRHNLIGLPSKWVVADDYLPSMEEAHAAHARRLAGDGREIERDGLVLRERASRLAGQMFGRLERRGWIVPSKEPGRWRLTWVAAFRLVFVLLAGASRAARARPKAAAPEAAPHDALDRQYATQQSLSWSKKDKRWLSLASLAAFAVLGAWIWDWTFMLVLAAVIGVHEGGHALAMRLVGYRDLHVFFLPGLGGLATGRKADATPLQKVFVYLAGPMPGLVAALAAVILLAEGESAMPSWALQLLFATIAINYLNLLPITPLDGGRVAESLLFARVPLLRLGFAAACALGLFAAGIATGDTVLAVIGGLIVISLPHQWRTYRVERHLPLRTAGLALEEAKAAVFAACTHPEFARWSFQDRSAVANALVEEVQSRHPRWAESVAGLAVYAACLVVPAWAVLEHTTFGEAVKLLAALDPPGEAPAGTADSSPPPPPARNWSAEIAASAGQPAEVRARLLLEAFENEHVESATADYADLPKKARAIAQELPPGHPVRGRATVALAQVSPDAEREKLLDEVLAQFADARGKDRLVVAEALVLRANHDTSRRSPEATAAFERALAIQLEELPADDANTGHTRGELARRLYDEGRREEAGALLRQSADALAGAPAARRMYVESDLAGFLIETGRAAEAESRLSALLAPPGPGAGAASGFAFGAGVPAITKLLWSQLAQGDPAAAARARATLAQQEAGAGPKAQVKWRARNLPVQLDRLAVARASGDAALEGEARAAIADILKGRRPPAQALCRAYGPEIVALSPWDRRRNETHARLVNELGLCRTAG